MAYRHCVRRMEQSHFTNTHCRKSVRYPAQTDKSKKREEGPRAHTPSQRVEYFDRRGLDQGRQDSLSLTLSLSRSLSRALSLSRAFSLSLSLALSPSRSLSLDLSLYPHRDIS